MENINIRKRGLRASMRQPCAKLARPARNACVVPEAAILDHLAHAFGRQSKRTHANGEKASPSCPGEHAERTQKGQTKPPSRPEMGPERCHLAYVQPLKPTSKTNACAHETQGRTHACMGAPCARVRTRMGASWFSKRLENIT